MWNNNNVLYYLIAVAFLIALIAIILNHGCDRKSNENITFTSDTIYVEEIVRVHDTLKIKEPYRVTVSKTDTLVIDTANIIKEYFTENRYNPSYKDSNIELNTDIAVFNNQLKSFHFDYTIYQKEKIITNEIVKTEKDVFFWSLGGGPSYDFRNKVPGLYISTTIASGTRVIGIKIDPIHCIIGIDYQRKIAKIKK